MQNIEEVTCRFEIAQNNSPFTGALQELDKKVKSMMETSQNRLPNGPGRAKICKVCGKEGQSMGIRDHIEANHLEGVSLPCNVCGQKVLCNKLSHRVVRQLIAQNPSRCKLL